MSDFRAAIKLQNKGTEKLCYEGLLWTRSQAHYWPNWKNIEKKSQPLLVKFTKLDNRF